MTGAFESAIACMAAIRDMCEISTIMPSRFISAITFLPNMLIPLFGASVVASPE